MSDGEAEVADKLAQLRQAFDGSFTLPPRREATGLVRLLVVGVGGQRLAIRLEALVALEALPKPVPLPGSPPELLGLVGLRARLVPVYSLARLMGAEPAGEPRWLLLVGADEPLGLAVEGFHGQREVAAHEFRAAGADRARAHLPEFVHENGSVCGVVDLPSVVRAIGGRAAGPWEE